MGKRILVLLLLSNVILLASPLSSHELIWNQDPWVHQHFSNLLLEQGFDAFKDPIAQAIGQGTLQYFPLYHFLLAGMKGFTGMQNWDVYRFLFVTLPLINIFSTYLLASSLFSQRTGVYAAIIASTSFFQLHNLYFIGLTYNVLFIGLGILTLFFLLQWMEEHGNIWLFSLPWHPRLPMSMGYSFY
jgi:hypothetical protein